MLSLSLFMLQFFAFIFSLRTMIIFVFLHGSHIGFCNDNTDREVRSTIATQSFQIPAGTGSTWSILLHAGINHVSRCRETTYNLTPRCVVRQISPPAMMTPFLDDDRQSKPRLSRPYMQGITTCDLYNGRLSKTWRTDKSNQGGDGSRNNKMNR